MSQALRQRLFDQLDCLELIDPHSHINPHQPAASTLADILGYHYYTELAHSAGLSRDAIEDPGISPRQRVERLVRGLGPIENTVQFSWLIEMARELFGFGEDRVTDSNWESLFDAAQRCLDDPSWESSVLEKSRLRAVFLTNEFDDALEGFDTSRYVPCLRTDDLVFKLHQGEVVARLEAANGSSVRDAATLRAAIGQRFEHFASRGARACAISLPPDFVPMPIDEPAANRALANVLGKGTTADSTGAAQLSGFVFWTLAEMCAEYRLPFDLMIGVNRSVYAGGVYQGQDLFDSRVSLIQYRELFNAFPQVTFPISVLASVTNQELVAYSWIFPNVVALGHWWYSNVPEFIERDASARLEAVPQTKQIGYYSDMYKLEFALPKFAMYKRILAKVLAERFVIDRGWREERAFALGKQVLCDNVELVFGRF